MGDEIRLRRAEGCSTPLVISEGPAVTPRAGLPWPGLAPLPMQINPGDEDRAPALQQPHKLH